METKDKKPKPFGHLTKRDYIVRSFALTCLLLWNFIVGLNEPWNGLSPGIMSALAYTISWTLLVVLFWVFMDLVLWMILTKMYEKSHKSQGL